MRMLIVAVLVLTSGGCRYRMDPVPLRGDPFELRFMAGSWVGDYAGIESGRSGTIGFNISANADSAFGNVILTTRGEPNIAPTMPGNQPPLLSGDPRDVHLRDLPTIQTLRIRFVRIAGGRVGGMIQPYRAPDCQCLVHTVFSGSVVGDTIQGTFITTRSDDREQQGTWRVTRMRP